MKSSNLSLKKLVRSWWEQHPDDRYYLNSDGHICCCCCKIVWVKIADNFIDSAVVGIFKPGYKIERIDAADPRFFNKIVEVLEKVQHEYKCQTR